MRKRTSRLEDGIEEQNNVENQAPFELPSSLLLRWRTPWSLYPLNARGSTAFWPGRAFLRQISVEALRLGCCHAAGSICRLGRDNRRSRYGKLGLRSEEGRVREE